MASELLAGHEKLAKFFLFLLKSLNFMASLNSRLDSISTLLYIYLAGEHTPSLMGCVYAEYASCIMYVHNPHEHSTGFK